MYEPTSETQASPIIDVTGDSTFQIVESRNENGELQATPVIIVGGGTGTGTDTGWIPLELASDWQAASAATYGTPSYRIINGVVYFKGLVSRIGTHTNTLIATLPLEVRPTKSIITSVTISANGIFSVIISESGNISQANSTNVASLNLGMIIYPLAITTSMTATTITNDITNLSLTGDTLAIDMLSGTHKEVDLAKYVDSVELTTALSTKANVGASYTKLEEDNLLSAKVDKTSIVAPTIDSYTTNWNIPTTETLVPTLSITVPQTGLYEAVVRLNIKKPSGGGTSIIYAMAKINGVTPPLSNLGRQRSVTNDGSTHSLEFTYDGMLTQGDILTLGLRASSSGCNLDNFDGFMGCQVSLKKIIE